MKKETLLALESLDTIKKEAVPCLASGCASSASSMSALVTCLNNAFQLNLSLNELSAIARRGSGSA
ncbi:MAG: hypothetical protein IIV28_04440, partial [Alistipes sp.]|nr:hypothetical protein [Alistipes sp.]